MAPGLVRSPRRPRAASCRPTSGGTRSCPPTGARRPAIRHKSRAGIVRRMVAASSKQGGWCLDFFAGSGTWARSRPSSAGTSSLWTAIQTPSTPAELAWMRSRAQLTRCGSQPETSRPRVALKRPRIVPRPASGAKMDSRIAAVPFTLRNLKDLEDLGSNFDGAPDLEFRAAGKALGLEQCGLCYQRIRPTLASHTAIRISSRRRSMWSCAGAGG